MKSQELTLLQVFDAIMTEGSVTRAGQRLAMSQPAVSNAIARMRDIWKDPVFVKKGRQIEPTAFAQSLWAQVRDPMQQLSSALESRGFDPAQSHRQFRIAIADLSVDLYWLPFSCQVAALAPDVDLYAVTYTRMGVIEQLRECRSPHKYWPWATQSARPQPALNSAIPKHLQASHAQRPSTGR